MTKKASAIPVDSRASEYYRLAKEFDGLDPMDLNPTLHNLKMVTQRYQSPELIAEGGVKRIFKVYDAQTKRHLAMAMLRESAPEELCDPFIHEAWLTAQLAHPNIITIHDIGVNAGGRPYFTMDLEVGASLQELLDALSNKRQGLLSAYSQEEMLQIFLKICDAISYAHQCGVIHLDLKPANIQIGEFGEVRVCDWGMGKLIGQEEDPLELDRQLLNPDLLNSVTLFGELKGTPGNMAPEQVRKNTKVDVRTDIYGLGSILYSMLTLQRPLSGETKEILERTKQGAIVPPIKRSPERDIPPALNAVVMKAMALSLNQRYASVAELKEDIQRYLSGFATEAEHAGLGKLFKLFYVRNRLICNLVIISSFLLLAGGIAAFVKVSNARRHAERMLALYEASRSELEMVSLENADSIQQFSKRLLLTGSDMRAKAVLETALQSDPGSPVLRRAMGEYYFVNQEFNEAATYMERGINSDDVVSQVALEFSRIKPDDSAMLSVSDMIALLEGLVDHDPLRQLMVIKDQHRRFDLTERAQIIEKYLRLLNPDWIDGWFQYDRNANRLRMGGEGLKGIPAPSKELEGLNLRELDISGSEIGNLAAVKNLAIERLDIHDTPVKEIFPIKRAVYLRELVVDPGQIPAGQLAQLQHVRIIEHIGSQSD